MTQAEELDLAKQLTDLQNHPGFKRFMAHIDETIKDGLEAFIELPAEKITEPIAFAHKAKYKVLKDEVRDWFSDNIKRGNEAAEILRKEAEKESKP